MQPTDGLIGFPFIITKIIIIIIIVVVVVVIVIIVIIIIMIESANAQLTSNLIVLHFYSLISPRMIKSGLLS